MQKARFRGLFILNHVLNLIVPVTIPMIIPLMSSLPVVVPIIMMPPFFISFMLIMPMISVTIFMTVPDEYLVIRIPAVLGICCPVIIIMQVRLGLVHYHFMAMKKVVSPVPGR